VVVVGYDFKRRRFAALHRAALRLPEEAFRYEGSPTLNEGAIKVGFGGVFAAAIPEIAAPIVE
jgi:hypothetical protein